MKDLLKKYKKYIVALILLIATISSMIVAGHTPTFDEIRIMVTNAVSGDPSANTQKVEDILNDLPAAE